jgi:DNA-binding transcriptional LysR family regulator
MWPAIDPREIRVFLTLAEELHFGHTADRLGVTHSRVSQVIRTLESHVGGRLFDRTSRHVTLTPLGKELQQRMISSYEQMQRAYLDVREMATGVAGTLRLGIPHFAGVCPHFSEILKVFEARHPGAHVQVIETGFERDQFEWLRRDEIDLLAMRLPVSDPEVVIGPVLSREERVLAVATDHPLAERSSVSVEDLADYTTTDIPGFSREVMDAYSPPRTPSGRPIRRAAVRSVTEVMTRVAAGEVVHPTLPAVMSHSHHPGIVVVPIRDLAPTETALVWLRSREGIKIQAFAQTAADVVSAHARGELVDQRAQPDRTRPYQQDGVE